MTIDNTPIAIGIAMANLDALNAIGEKMGHVVMVQLTEEQREYILRNSFAGDTITDPFLQYKDKI